MLEICSQDKCTGCWACVNACPKQCIKMEEGFLGHLFPTIDQSLCVDCGLCRKTCPANEPASKTIPLHTYACWAKDTQEYVSSTSGAVASVLARNVLDKNGTVYGCSGTDGFDIKHIRIADVSDVEKLKGSKYVQSSINNTYRQVKSDLQSDTIVLFVGTPCQIAGLKAYLKKDYSNLYLVDIICHGVPSRRFLTDHLSGKVQGAVSKVSFRTGKNYCLKATDATGTVLYESYLKPRYNDVYLNAFYDGHTLRNSCHTCRYASPERVSDITVGDFWGLKQSLGDKDHEDGISCVLINSEKGERLFEGIKEQLYVFERSLDEAVKGNSQLRHPMSLSRRIRFFQSAQSVIGIPAAYRMAEADRILKYRLKKLRKK